MKKSVLYLISLSTGILLSLAWPTWGFSIISFVALIPMLFVIDYIHNNRADFIRSAMFLYLLSPILLWNAITTWWIWNSTEAGAVFAIVANSIFTTTALVIFTSLRKRFLTKTKAYLAFVSIWIAWEHLHMRWDLSWSWLNLGNLFATNPQIIQWYEYTGALGGTLWILLINILIYELILAFRNKKLFNYKATLISITTLVLFVPIIFSIIKYHTYKEVEDPVEVVVIQQNTDPWEQYYISSEDLIHNILSLARQKITSNTALLVGPESAIQDYAWEDKLDEYSSLDSLLAFVDEYPNLNIVLGISTLQMYKDGAKPSATARKYRNTDMKYDSYNTALFLNNNKQFEFYHKSKLVPGVEKMPYPQVFKPLEKYAINLGGAVGSLGVDTSQKAFELNKIDGKVGSAICYESIYGEFYSEFVKNGATIMTIITNDGWWGNTPGYRQHFEFARLRAIESRRSIARAANTGYSGFINQRGDVLQKTKWWEAAVIEESLNQNSKITFYTQYGDFIGRISLITALTIIFLYILHLIFPNIRKVR